MPTKPLIIRLEGGGGRKVVQHLLNFIYDANKADKFLELSLRSAFFNSIDFLVVSTGFLWIILP